MNWLRRLFSARLNVVVIPREKKKPVSLSKHMIELMVEDYKSGTKPKELASLFNISMTTVYKYIRGIRMFKTINGGKLPTKATRFSAAVDLYANADVVIKAGETAKIP